MYESFETSQCEQLINAITELITVSAVKEKITSLFKTNTTKNYTNTCQKYAWRSKETMKTKNKKKQSEDKMIKTIEDRIMRNIKNHFEQKH